MAISASFKQQCPSCEAMVPVKDASMIGKKIDCPKCKYRFVVEEPADDGDTSAKKQTKSVMEDDDADGAGKGQKTRGAKTAVKTGKAKTKTVNGAAADPDEEVSTNGRSAAAAKAKTKRLRDAEDDEPDESEEDDAGPQTKTTEGSKKLILGVGLAAVGVVVLVFAAMFLFGGKKNSPPAAKPNNFAPATVEKQPENPVDDKKKEEDVKPAPVVESNMLPPAGAELTNLLPPDTEHVLHVFFKNVFHLEVPLREAVFSRTAFGEEELQQKLGLSVLAIDDLIRAQRYTAPAWAFTVVHTTQAVDEKALAKALNLQAKEPIKKQPYYVASQRLAWLEQLGKLSFGAPVQLRHFRSAQEARPLYVRVHNPQTLIFADEAPMRAFLKAEGKFRFRTEEKPAGPAKPGANKPGTPGGFKPPIGGPDGFKPATGGADGPKPPAGGAGGLKPPAGGSDGLKPPAAGPDGLKPPAAGPNALKPPTSIPPATSNPDPAGAYLTINPGLKDILDRMEKKASTSKEMLLFSSATDMVAAQVPPSDPDFQDRMLWQFRQIWDASNLVQGKKAQILRLGTNFRQQEPQVYRFHNEFICADSAQARELRLDFLEQGAPKLAQFMDSLLAHKVELPTAEPEKKGPGQGKPATGIPGGFQPGGFQPGGFQPGGQPKPAVTKPEESPKVSRVRLGLKEEKVDFTLDLVFDQAAFANLYKTIEVITAGLKNEMDLAGAASYRHRLGKAVRELGQQGLSERGVSPGYFPPGAFKRPLTSLRSARDPDNRVSWMAGLLPYLGRKDLYDQINFDLSWKDPGNWLSARTLVPEFLDPAYPAASQFASNAHLPIEVGATHYVGIAGVGLDAADYLADDPALDAAERAIIDLKRGVLSYEISRGIDEVKKNRGLANTILLIQVPHDGPTGVTPWLAGGGSTLRGVPDKKSIDPFVLTSDRDGQPILYNGKPGTFAIMVDGTVRFIDAKIPDPVFQAMCTVKGPALDPQVLDTWAPVVPETKDRQALPMTPPKQQKQPPVTEEASQLPERLRINMLKRIGLAYHSCLDANKGRPPAGIDDLAPFYEKDAQVTEALKKGQFIVIWQATLKNMPAGTSNTILGYEKDVETKGGLVLMADASVRTMTAAEFRKATKAQGK